MNGAMRAQSPGLRAAAALLGVLLLGCACNGHGAFFRLELHLDLWGSIGVIGLLAVGQCLVILGGGIDLSVGSVLALGNMVFAALMLQQALPWWLAVPAAGAVGAALGLANGSLVACARLQPFLATLATMVIARGLARFLPQLWGLPASSKFVPRSDSCPPFWEWLGGRLPGGLPVVGAVFAACAALAATLVRRLVAGRWLYAVGGNEEAARLAGVPVARVKLAAYAACGLLAGLAGCCQAARDVQGNPGAGEMFELQAIAAVVIGGNSLRGGHGSIGLAVFGVLTIGYLEKVLAINSVATHWRLVIQGLIILAAVMLQDRRR